MLRRRVAALIAVLSLAGCARNSATEGANTDPATVESRAVLDTRPASSAASRTSDVITAAELADPSVRNGDALEAVRRLRPRFLNTRGKGSIRVSGAGSVHVSLNGGPLQTLSFLSRMRPTEIEEIRYLNSTEATQRFGTAAGGGGVLLIKNR